MRPWLLQVMQTVLKGLQRYQELKKNLQNSPEKCFCFDLSMVSNMYNKYRYLKYLDSVFSTQYHLKAFQLQVPGQVFFFQSSSAEIVSTSVEPVEVVILTDRFA